jgi:1,2-diacylglycerol 3-alpha-glucosyltransferase
MKIVHVCLTGPYTDNYGYQENIIPRYHAMDGHEVTIITSTATFGMKENVFSIGHTEAGEYILDNGIKVIRLKNKSIERLRVFPLYEVLCKEKPDFIYVHGIQFFSLLDVAKYKRTHPCKVVADNHADFYNSANGFLSKNILHKVIWRYIVQKALSSIEKIYNVTPWGLQFAKELYGIPDNKLDLLYLAADDEKAEMDKKDEIRIKIRKELGIGKDDFVIVTGGRLDILKRTHHLLNAFLNINVKDAHLIVFGDIKSSYKAILEPLLKSAPNIHYIGWISSDSVYRYFHASDLAVFPGTQSVLWQQAIFCGLPTILRKWPKGDYLNQGNAIFLYTDNVSELEQWLRFIYKYRDLVLPEMSSIALNVGKELFSYKNISRKVLEN